MNSLERISKVYFIGVDCCEAKPWEKSVISIFRKTKGGLLLVETKTKKKHQGKISFKKEVDELKRKYYDKI